jgi:hypothetical protein
VILYYDSLKELITIIYGYINFPQSCLDYVVHSKDQKVVYALLDTLYYKNGG